jgi:hypothetical protein
MGRKRRLNPAFSLAKKEKLKTHNIGHSWFENDDNVCDIEHYDKLPNDSEQVPSVSELKFCPTSDSYNLENGHRIVDINMLSAALSQFAVCFVCKMGTLAITETPTAGWVTEMGFVCSNEDCRRSNVDNIEKFFSSTKDDQGHAYVVNRNMVLAMRNIGKGWSGAMKFSAVMGLPKPISRTSFTSQTQFWKNAAEDYVRGPVSSCHRSV